MGNYVILKLGKVNLRSIAVLIKPTLSDMSSSHSHRLLCGGNSKIYPNKEAIRRYEINEVTNHHLTSFDLLAAKEFSRDTEVRCLSLSISGSIVSSKKFLVTNRRV
jgi:hypothetical protein